MLRLGCDLVDLWRDLCSGAHLIKAMADGSLTIVNLNRVNRVKEIIDRLATGEVVSLEERIKLQKYAIHIPFIAVMLSKAIRNRSELK